MTRKGQQPKQPGVWTCKLCSCSLPDDGGRSDGRDILTHMDEAHPGVLARWRAVRAAKIRSGTEVPSV